MNDTTIQRLEKLERQHARLKRWGLALAVIAGATVLMGQASPRENTQSPERIAIVDSDGRERIVLECGKSGPTISLKGTSKASTQIAVSDDSSGITIMDEGGKQRIVLTKDLRKDGGAGLWLYDDQGTPRLAVGIDKGGPGVVTFDEKGKRAN